MRTLGFQMINEGLMLTRAGYRILLEGLYVNSRAELEALLLDNGVAGADIESTIDSIWTAMTDPDTGVAYANYAAFDNQIYNQGGILKEDIVAAIPTATSPGTANLVAAYDFDDAGGTGQNDLHTAGPYNLTENGTSAWTTGTPNYYNGATSADYLSSTGLSAAWASSEQDWSMVARYKDAGLNRSPYSGGGTREYITFTSGNGHQGRIGGGPAVTVNTSASYAGEWVTVYMEYNSSTNKVTVKVLNENLSATSAAFTPSWNTSESQIGAANGDGGDIDFMYFFSDLLTADEILWFGNNSSIPRIFSDL